MKVIQTGLNLGQGFTLTDIRNRFNSRICAAGLESDSNREVKTLPTNTFNDEITFSYPSQRNQSILVMGKGANVQGQWPI